jgi:hypothetical protein
MASGGWVPGAVKEFGMRLEYLCRFRMRYARSSWHYPYSRGSARGEEGLGFGQGEGQATGEIEGNLVWANYPRRREDGVWMPNLRGYITTKQGHEILVSIHGQSVEEVPAGRWRAILARVELTSKAEPYRWLNTCFVVGEGEIDEESEEWWLTTYVCVNEVAQGPPAIGTETPERFRQTRGVDRADPSRPHSH